MPRGKLRVLGLRTEFRTDEGDDSFFKNGFTFDNEFGSPLDANKSLYENLFINENDSFIVSSSPKAFCAIHEEDFGDEFFISEEELDAYAEGVLEVLTKQNIESVITSEDLDADELLNDAALDDADVKLSLYRSFKSLYDKWISRTNLNNGATTSGYFFNNYGQDDDRALFDHFNFVNRGASDIGSKAVIDTAYLSDMSSSKNGEGPTQSLYNLIGNLLSKNNFDFFALPSYIQYTERGEEDLLDMFRAISTPIGKIPPRPSFVCMYISGNSRSLYIPRSNCNNNIINLSIKFNIFITFYLLLIKNIF